MPDDTGPRIETHTLSALAPGALDRAVALLQAGEVIAFPTDTVYGAGAHGLRPDAVERLYRVKGRPDRVPIPLLLPDRAALERVCVDIPVEAIRLVERFWPGGLSLVLRRAALVPDVVTSGRDTVAVRMPDQPLVWALCRRLGAPLAATSANRHGWPSPVTASEVATDLEGRIPLILDGGPCPGGVASTIVDLTVSPPRILRPGPVSAEALVEVLGIAPRP
jgi:L-threonylcarbamoyladenylate synthase